MTDKPDLNSLPEPLAAQAKWLLTYIEAGSAPSAQEIEQRLAIDARNLLGQDLSLVELAKTIGRVGEASLTMAIAASPAIAVLEFRTRSGDPWFAYLQVDDEPPYGLIGIQLAEGEAGQLLQSPDIKLAEWDEVDAVLDGYCGGAMQASLVHDGKIAWTRCWGEADAGVKATADTLFQAGSISKSVAAFTIVRLANAGLLDLDKDVNDYLTSWKLRAPGEWQPRITLRMLLRHFACTSVHGFGGYAEGETVPSAAELLAGKGNSDPVYVAGIPGLGFRYSGGGTITAQLVACEATGRSFPDLAAEFTLGPLKMNASTFEQPLPERFHSLAARAFEGKKPIKGRWNTYPEIAAAGLWTTTRDLVKFGQGVAAALQGLDGALLPQNLAREMADSPDNYPVGMGLFSNAGKSFGHDGANRAFFGTFGMSNDGRNGFVALSNADGGHHLFGPMQALAGSDTDSDMQSPSNAGMIATMQPPINDVVSPLTGERLLGRWKLSVDGHIEITSDQGQYTLTAPGQAPIPLQQLDEQTWQPKGLVSRIRLEAGEGGDVLVISQLGARYRVSRD